tara:strand:- start:202 stop:429 length:228 start_codon:yes stop_codon:yes gene_type:complete
MPKIKIDDLEYNTEDLTEKGLEQLRSLQFLETQMLHMRKEVTVYQVARSTYLSKLKAEIEELGIEPSDEEANKLE